MVGTPLTASSIRLLAKGGGWECRLAPDERIPEGSWAISPDLFAAYVCTNRSDTELRYAQVMWTTLKLHEKKWLILGQDEDGLSAISFEDGTTDFGFVLTGIWNTQDLADAATELRYDDSAFKEFTFPREEGRKRHIPRDYDQWGRHRSFSATCNE